MKRLPKALILVGLIIFFTDMSSEMIYPLLPIFPAGTLGAGALAIGVRYLRQSPGNYPHLAPWVFNLREVTVITLSFPHAHLSFIPAWLSGNDDQSLKPTAQGICVGNCEGRAGGLPKLIIEGIAESAAALFKIISEIWAT